MSKHSSSKPMYYYISSKAAYDPCKTIYLCAPGEYCGTAKDAEQFAIQSGWQSMAEEQAAILVMPLAVEGWEKEPDSLLFDLYNKTKDSFPSRSGKAIWGRMGSLWCWETIIYLAGYEDGAIYAGNVLVNYPNMFAGVALVNGVPNNYSGGENASNHWMVKNVSEDYNLKNCQIPVHLYMFEESEAIADEAIGYFSKAFSKENPAEQVCVFSGQYSWKDNNWSRTIWEECFNHVIRWKNGPDGTLAIVDSKEEFYSNPRYIRHTVALAGVEYEYFVHLPKGKNTEDVKGLPLVFTIHGRGEPAWMFTTKNGWDTLADETQEFIVVSPDSPGNSWFLYRDAEVFPQIIDQMVENYEIDRTRVYLTGFSNGAIMTREMACYRPDLFAAVAPSNGPWFDTKSMQMQDTSKTPENLAPEVYQLMERFERDGWEMPCAFFYGDSDPGIDAVTNPTFGLMIRANHCEETPFTTYTKENFFTEENGYRQGDRFYTKVFGTNKKEARVCVTIMKNMPHGAIEEEARFTWAFVKKFCRLKGEKKCLVL